MELNWLQSLIMGLVSGLTDILPVSSQAHQTLLFTFFGGTGVYPVVRLMIHGATLITVLIFCWGRIGRIRRQLRLARLPRRRRSRTVEMAPIMDAKMLRTAAVPVVLGAVLWVLTSRLRTSLLWLTILSLVNAAILYLPRMFPTANKDSRHVTPGESLLMGLGAGASALPGISSIGASYSIGVLHGMDHTYMLHLSLIMHLMVTAGRIVYDVMDILRLGTVALHTAALVCYGLAAVSAAAGAALGLRLVRRAAERSGLSKFSYYSFGVALFTFLLYLIV